MSLGTIPEQILTATATLKAPVSVDAYGKPAYESYELSKVHIQRVQGLRKGKQDKEVVFNGTLFFDCRLSQPSLDFNVLQRTADALNAQMKLEYAGNVYTVESIDLLPDDFGNLHHLEIYFI